MPFHVLEETAGLWESGLFKRFLRQCMKAALVRRKHLSVDGSRSQCCQVEPDSAPGRGPGPLLLAAVLEGSGGSQWGQAKNRDSVLSLHGRT
jgi:hypothetical protein